MSFLVGLSVLYQSEKKSSSVRKLTNFPANCVPNYTHIQRYKFQFLLMLNIIYGCLNFRQRSHFINTKHEQTSAHLQSLTISMDELLRWNIKYVLKEPMGIKFQMENGY